MNARKLLWTHRYSEAVARLRRDLAKNPGDMASVETMADALRANGDYGEALRFFQRLSTHREQDNVANVLAPGSDAWQIDIACLHWLLNDRSNAILLMHKLVVGILDGAIKYGDAAGGMSQGLLLYYMAITANIPEEASFSLDYLRNRVESSFGVWPSPVAQHYLGNISFDDLMEAVNRQRTMAVAIEPTRLELARRRRLTLALFHDGLRARAQRDEEHCLVRMRECYGLENPMIEQEWYLARYEVERAER